MKREIDFYPLMNVRLVFGPFWYRWWLILFRGGKHHITGTGESCVIFKHDPLLP